LYDAIQKNPPQKIKDICICTRLDAILKGFSSALLGGGMVALLSFSWLPMMTQEALAVPDKFSMLSFSWLPRMIEEMHAGYDKFGIEEIYPIANNGSVWYINNQNPQSDNNFYFRSLEDTA
jgi:hypothetical protein